MLRLFWCDRGLEGRPYGQRARRVRSPFWLMCRKTRGVVLRVVNGGLGWSRARFVVVAVFAYVGLSLVGAPRALCCFEISVSVEVHQMSPPPRPEPTHYHCAWKLNLQHLFTTNRTPSTLQDYR